MAKQKKSKSETKNKVLYVRLTKPLRDQVSKWAEDGGVSEAAIVRAALVYYFSPAQSQKVGAQ
jgi:hypothetical protein